MSEEPARVEGSSPARVGDGPCQNRSSRNHHSSIESHPQQHSGVYSRLWSSWRFLVFTRSTRRHGSAITY